jgi:hypothetical protein
LTTFPAAIIILDFYHAPEHLADFATLVFSSDSIREEWIEMRQKEMLAMVHADTFPAIPG